MSKIDQFKEFVKNNSGLVNYVRDNDKSWQDLYEIYDMYGDDKDVWDNYLKDNKNTSTKSKNTSLNDLINMAKNIDVDKVQSGISSLQKAISLFGELFVTGSSSNNTSKGEYEPRPLYRRFDD